MRAFPTNPPSLGQSPRNRPVEFVIMSSAPYEDLARLVERFIAEASKNPGLMNLDSDLRLDKPELKVSVNRDKIVDVGASVDAVGRTLETMLGGRQVTRFKRDGEQYDVVVQVADADRRTPGDISDIYVRGKGNEMIQLSNLVTVRESVAPKSLNHFNRIRAVTITATLAPGYTLGQALAFMQETARKVLPPTAQTDLNGQSREFRDSSTDIYFVFVLALAFIYLVLSAQFESFIDPFVIMLTVPLSMTGALLALKLSGGTLNVYSQIGLITLVGLITKHGILIVEFSNQMQAQGKGVHGGGGGGRGPAAAPDPHDHGRDGAGRGAARALDRGRVGIAPADRLGDRRRACCWAPSSRSSSCPRPTRCSRGATGPSRSASRRTARKTRGRGTSRRRPTEAAVPRKERAASSGPFHFRVPVPQPWRARKRW